MALSMVLSSIGQLRQWQELTFLSSYVWFISYLGEEWHIILSFTLVVKANHIKKKLGKNFFIGASSTFIVTFISQK